MSNRRLPVRPNLDQLKHQAKDLLRAIKRGDPDALAELAEYHPIDPVKAKLADAQHTLARSYEAPSWMRLVTACKLVDAIWEHDTPAAQRIISANPQLIHEDVLIRKSNWGWPMSYAANLGWNDMIEMFVSYGATDFQHALERATLQGKIETARLIHQMMGRPIPADGCLGDPAYTLSVSGTALMLELGARLWDDEGKSLVPIGTVLGTDSRKPEAKHAILEMYVSHGFELPDTPTMALHRGRFDLLEEHLRRDPSLLSRTFSHEEIYPPEMGCGDEIQMTQGTPLKGTTLLHLCVDYDEYEIAEWLLAKGMDPDARAATDAEGYGGHTALFGTVVSQPNFWMNFQSRPQVAPFAELLLKAGAAPNPPRVSLRKQLHPGYGEEPISDFHDLSPLSWGERFARKVFVSEPAMALIREAGGAM